ncbi:hypothetical protein HELRODRAFT_166386 [Helobdella robusta]|uniref:Voltage-dependent calcium channel gamma-7 subunit n=1 Tax=Helobdella robusta TaxID=6412 RepID=T1EY27_HELRO|nr:hypothetical protein HELRODRAFT_166386 [Helobdella robusta]ESN90681.1 hypothetical protein HELRODRAFT_166386 [Helobdella robusta]
MIVPSDEDYIDSSSSSSSNNSNDINNTNSQSSDPDPYYTANAEAEDENSEDDEKYQDKTEFDGSKFLVKVNVHSGLWRSCVMGSEDQIYDDGITFHCTNIEYFGQDTDRTETTHAINRAIRKAAPVITGSLLIMVVALSLSILGSNRRDVRSLLAAILYITSALSLALGVILYISAVNDEVSHRRKSITGERDGFLYRYGWAFFFNGISFIASMIAAVNNISLYLLRPASPQQSAEGSNHVGNIPSSRSRIMINSMSESHALFEHDKESTIMDKDSNTKSPTSPLLFEYAASNDTATSSNSTEEEMIILMSSTFYFVTSEFRHSNIEAVKPGKH